MQVKEVMEIQNTSIQCGSFERFSVIARTFLMRPLHLNYLAGKVFIDPLVR